MSVREPCVPDFKERIRAVDENAVYLFIYKVVIEVRFNYREISKLLLPCLAIVSLEARKTNCTNCSWCLVIFGGLEGRIIVLSLHLQFLYKAC